MSDIKITKITATFLKVLYKEYKLRIKSGIDSKNSRFFYNNQFAKRDECLKKFSDSNVGSCINELKAINFIEYIDVVGNFRLSAEAISYSENIFKNSVLNSIDVLSKFIPWELTALFFIFYTNIHF